MGAAVVGLVGAAGIFLYEQIYAEKRRAMLVRDVARLDNQVATMRQELENLRELQNQSRMKRAKHKRTPKAVTKPDIAPSEGGDELDRSMQSTLVPNSYLSDSEYYTDYNSILGTDVEMDSEEFYDVRSDSERDMDADEDDEDVSEMGDVVKNGVVKSNMQTEFLKKETEASAT